MSNREAFPHPKYGPEIHAVVVTSTGRADHPEISVMLRHDEAAYIEASQRCSPCGHIMALHYPPNELRSWEWCPLCNAECRTE